MVIQKSVRRFSVKDLFVHVLNISTIKLFSVGYVTQLSGITEHKALVVSTGFNINRQEN